MKLTAVLIHTPIARSRNCYELLLRESGPFGALHYVALPPTTTVRIARDALRPRGSLNTFNCTIVCLARLPISIEGLVPNLCLKSIVSERREQRKRGELIASASYDHTQFVPECGSETGLGEISLSPLRDEIDCSHRNKRLPWIERSTF